MSRIIEPFVEKLRVDCGLTPIVACEIEFYLHDASTCADIDGFWRDVVAGCVAANVPIFNYEKEKGREQYEVALGIADPLKAAVDTIATKDAIAMLAAQYNMRADFSAKPFESEPGSGLHVHVHLEDSAGKNVFYKDDERMSDALRFSLGGLLDAMPRSMSIFAPTEDSKKRFVGKTNAPTTISWGANNRTTALRLPDSAKDKKRIEHRVAGSDADPAAVIAVILEAIHDGLTRRLKPNAQIYGDAADSQYGLIPILP